MTTHFALPLITGIFLGGIVTEVRWVLRVRQLQNQLDLNGSKNLEKATTLARLGAPQEAQSSESLHSLRDHLTAEAGKTPAKEPANVGKRDL